VFPDGVWLVELAPLADPALVPQTVAIVLGLKEEPGRPLLVTLTDYLRGKKALLVLDNCEHLIQASAQFTEVLLQVCPHLHILSSSREMLGVAGERSFYVPSLSTPEPRAALPVDTLIGYDAVRLFVERAVAVLPQFVLTGDNALAVAQVCRQLDGIPLAIELAAARVKLLQVEQIAERLDDRFRLLTGGSRTALPRHQTLTALIDWSHDLLSEPERALLRRLSVFAGGWTLEAAEVVGVDAGTEPDEILDLLTQLVNKSLVIAERAQGEEARYRMLETIRQYALEKLTASGEADAVRQRHAEHYLALAEAGVSVNPRVAWLDQMATEYDNLRAALTWSQQATSGPELGLRLARLTSGFALWRGYGTEGRNWLEAALAYSDAQGAQPTPARAWVLLSLGAGMGDYAAGQSLMSQSLKIFQELGDRPAVAEVLNYLGWWAREHGDTDTARLRVEESIVLYRELGDKSGLVWALVTLGQVAVIQEDAVLATALLEEGLALSDPLVDTLMMGWAFNHLGHVAQIQGEYERARQLHKESLVLFDKIGERHVGTIQAHQSLGETALAQGDAALATTHFAEALALRRDLGYRSVMARADMAWCLAGLAGAAVVNEEPERAAWLWGAAEALRQSIGARPAPAARATHERLMAAAREQLGEAAFNAALAQGQKMTLEQAVAYALEGQAEG